MVASVHRDFVEWHRGRPRYALWAAAVDDAAVLARLARVREALAPLLLPGYVRQPHLTLAICGFPAAEPREPDEFGKADLDLQIDAIRRTGIRTAALRVGRAFSLPTAACLAVEDPADMLSGWRRACAKPVPGLEVTPYCPHVTAGLYREPWPLREVLTRLDALDTAAPIPLTIRHLCWMDYEARRIGGPLRTLLRVDVSSGLVQVPDPDALAAAFTPSGTPIPTGTRTEDDDGN